MKNLQNNEPTVSDGLAGRGCESVLPGSHTGAVLLGWSACVTLLVVTAAVWQALCPT